MSSIIYYGIYQGWLYSMIWDGGHSTFFLVGMYRTGLQKLGLGSGISLKNEGSCEQKFDTFAPWELKFWPKTRLRMQKISKNWTWGHMSGPLMVNWKARERRLAWIKGVMIAAHPMYHPPMVVPPYMILTSNLSYVHQNTDPIISKLSLSPSWQAEIEKKKKESYTFIRPRCT